MLQSTGVTKRQPRLSEEQQTTIYTCQCYSQLVPLPLTPTPTSLSPTSVSLFLLRKYVHLYHFSRFHIYVLIYNIYFSLSGLDLNIRIDTIKLLEKNLRKTCSDINHSKIFFDPPPRAMKRKAKINKWDLGKLKSFCTAKEIINKRERHWSEWEKIFANEATDKGLIRNSFKWQRRQRYPTPVLLPGKSHGRRSW